MRPGLRTPRAAAIAGIIFSALMIWSLVLLRVAMPDDDTSPGGWLADRSGRLSLALNLVPFAGVAFMWFLGVLRDRLGKMEDQFFATVFLSSGLLFLGMLFAAAAVAGGLIGPRIPVMGDGVDGAAYAFARNFAQRLMQVYAFKMAAVFMMTTSTLALHIRFTPRWIALTGYAGALFLLIGSSFFDWTFFVLPGWVLLVSVHILINDPERPSQAP